MFNTALSTAAVGTATDAKVSAVAEFLNFAVSGLGFGIDGVTSAGAPTESGDNVTGWTGNFTVNGRAANVVFSTSAAVFPVGAVDRQGATRADGADAGTTVGDADTDPWVENNTTPALTLWTAVVTIDGADAGTTLETEERVITVTKLVK